MARILLQPVATETAARCHKPPPIRAWPPPSRAEAPHAAVLVRPGVPRPRLAGGHRRRRGADRLVPDPQHHRNLAARHIATGFGFLGRVAGIPIGESLIPYNPAVNTFGRALLIGILNTLKVAVIGIVLATILGTLIGIGRLSRNWLLARITAFYVETLRDIPVLLQLLFWYTLLQGLPAPRQALHIGGMRVPVQPRHQARRCWTGSRRTPGRCWPSWPAPSAPAVEPPRPPAPGGHRRAARRLAGRARPADRPAASSSGPCWARRSSSTCPALHGFNFQGGGTLSPEYFALLLGLVTYTASYIAEIVRSGIQAVPQGQWEAAGALGLRRGAVLRQIVLPQALRVIIPPMTSQYLNLTKNSSLAVAIGFQDIVSIANTTLNQTGQAIEGIAIIMAVYLTISLSISLFMNWYNAHIALVER